MRVLAVDLGASSGRVMAVNLEDGMMTMEEIHRFSNEGIAVGQRLYTETAFPPVMPTGSVRGRLSDRVCRKIRLDTAKSLQVISAAQHDSASAAAAVPAEEEFYIFINSGTWSIIGMVMDEPVINDRVRLAHYSNEGAAGGKVKMVNTIMGMWFIQELRKCWETAGKPIDYEYLIAAAEAAPPLSRHIDVEDTIFEAPDDMEAAINEYFGRTGQEETHDQGLLYRCVMESLALHYRKNIEELEDLTGKTVDKVYLLGGAVQDRDFCRYIADATGKIVCAGPTEATAAGNALVQFDALGVLPDGDSYADVIRRSFEVRQYFPANREMWNKAYRQIVCR